MTNNTPTPDRNTGNGPAGYRPGRHYDELGKLIHTLNPYSQDMDLNCMPTPGAPDVTVQNFQVEIDDYQGEWTFKNQMQKVERALRITYRYPLKDKDGNPNGLWATEHLLVGYAGGNGN